MSETKRMKKLTAELLKYRKEATGDFFWPWLSDLDGRPASKKRANKFLLGAVIDYQMKADVVWGNAARFAEEYLDDPKNLWERIARCPHSKWMSKRKRFGLHRFPKAHERVWRIAQVVVSQYGGDARNIWKGRTPEEVLFRLSEMRMGAQISKMVVGALLDTGQIEGTRGRSNVGVKADLNVCRVLGRSIYGIPAVDPVRAADVSHRMYPVYPWKLDASLFSIGVEFCKKTRPICSECPIVDICMYSSQKRRK